MLEQLSLRKYLTVMSGILMIAGCVELDAPDTAYASTVVPGVHGKADSTVDKVNQAEYPLTCSESPTGFNPNGVHILGNGPHFEGWYYRATNPATGESWVLISAYWQNQKQETFGFNELIHSPSGTIWKQVVTGLDLQRIQQQAGVLDVRIGGLHLFEGGVRGTIESEKFGSVELDWDIDSCVYWGGPSEWNNRWTMGWATEAPGVPLRWHVDQLKGTTTGTVSFGGEIYTIDGSALHQEKNWGRAFPSSWVWFQSNVFDNRPDVAFAAAGGAIFPVGWSPDGYMAGLRWKDQFFTWRTQDGHRFSDVDFSIDESTGTARWSMTAENLQHRMVLSVEAPADEIVPIDVPTDDGLRVGAIEHLAAKTQIRLYRRTWSGWKLMDTVNSQLMAAEAGGALARSHGLIP